MVIIDGSSVRTPGSRALTSGGKFSGSSLKVMMGISGCATTAFSAARGAVLATGRATTLGATIATLLSCNFARCPNSRTGYVENIVNTMLGLKSSVLSYRMLYHLSYFF